MDSVPGRLRIRLRYLRVNLFYALIRPVQKFMRSRRMSDFMKRLNVREGTTILDCGGQPMIWDAVRVKLNVTILNLPGVARCAWPSHHQITYVEGDACHAPQFADGQFDIVFSNSVIEHVGDEARQQAFAGEVQRIGKAFWIQTPSKYFPLEAHSGMPFWWFYPTRVQRYFLTHWRQKLPDWTEMVEGTRVLSAQRVKALFPTATVLTERLFGISKSYVAYRAPARVLATRARESAPVPSMVDGVGAGWSAHARRGDAAPP